MKINPTTIALIEADLRSGSTPFLAGNPGIGKTSIGKAIARSWATEAFVVSVNLLSDKADLTGARLVKTADGNTMEQQFFPHHKIRQAVTFAEENPHSSTLLILDEINRSTADVTSGALSITTEREIGISQFPSNLYIMATGNIRGNVTSLDDASLSRFSIYQIEPDAFSLIAHLDSRNNGTRPMNPWVKKVLTEHPETVYQVSQPESYSVVDSEDEDDPDTMNATFADLMDAGEEMLQLTTPRTIERVSDWLDLVTENGSNFELLTELLQTPAQIKDRTTTLLNESIEGKTGNTDFTTYLVSEISNALVSQQSLPQTPTATVPKPDVWEKLKTATTQDELDNLVSSMSDLERSTSIVYSLYNNQDNTIILSQLLAQANELDPENYKQLGQLFSSSRINDTNVDAATQISSPVSRQIEALSKIFNI